MRISCSSVESSQAKVRERQHRYRARVGPRQRLATSEGWAGYPYAAASMLDPVKQLRQFCSHQGAMHDSEGFREILEVTLVAAIARQGHLRLPARYTRSNSLVNLFRARRHEFGSVRISAGLPGNTLRYLEWIRARTMSYAKPPCRFLSVKVSSLIASWVIDGSISWLRKDVNPGSVAYRWEPHITDLLLSWDASLGTPR